VEVDQEIHLELEDQEMILLYHQHKEKMVEMETLLLLGVLVAVEEQRRVVVIGAQLLQELVVLEELHLLQDHLSLEVEEAAVEDRIMVHHLVDQQVLEVELDTQALEQEVLLQEQLILVAVVVEDNKHQQVNMVLLMEDLV
tara:strand:- start:50 stop:472 length:423 start_codon:yes stop_codon:yes gene_type:complete